MTEREPEDEISFNSLVIVIILIGCYSHEFRHKLHTKQTAAFGGKILRGSKLTLV